MNFLIRFMGGLLVFACAFARGAETNNAPVRLRIGVVQMALGRTIAENRARIMAGISNTAMRGVRVAVFPEGALRGKDGDQPALVDQAVSAIRQAVREAKLFVLFGGSTYSTRLKKDVNWMLVVGPDGRDVFRYEKLYDNHRATMPGVFHLDSIPCSTIICADRWLRGIEEIPIQQGAQISFELSCNFASEWVTPFEWYWYVPRALRNNVWAIFANTGNKVAGVPDDPSTPRELRHGHSAIIAPDGQITAAARDDAETIVVAELDISQATRDGAQARRAHPALRPFWEAGLKLHSGQVVQTPSFTPLKSSETEITMAVAQVTNNLLEMAAMWFRVKGVPAVVTIGQDALWTELAELAAVAGAQIHVHLDHDPASSPEAGLRRLQVWSNLASFQTFTATANVLGSAIWDDLRGLDERRAEVNGLPRPDTGMVEVYSSFSANLVVHAGAGPQLITVTRRVGPANLYHPRRTSNFNPQMDAWYRLGATIVHPN